MIWIFITSSSHIPIQEKSLSKSPSHFGAELSEFSPPFGSPSAEQEGSGGEVLSHVVERQLTVSLYLPLLPSSPHFLNILVFLRPCAVLWMQMQSGRWGTAASRGPPLAACPPAGPLPLYTHRVCFFKKIASKRKMKSRETHERK